MMSLSGKKHPGGRPAKFKSAKELQKKIDQYFSSCWEQKIDSSGNLVFLRNKNGVPTNKKIVVQIKPYTVSGLASYLGIDRDTLMNYEAKGEFFGTIKEAKGKCEAYAEESLFIGKNPSGAIFNLKNNYGWKDKNEIEHSGGLIWREVPPK